MQEILKQNIIKAIHDLYHKDINDVQFQKTRIEFEGDITIVVFPFLVFSKKNAVETAKEIGNYIINNSEVIEKFNVVKGFLNITIKDNFLIKNFIEIYNQENYAIKQANKDSPLYIVEYSSPNTNKPIHLGHLRNNFLGNSIAEILKANGKHVKKVQVINDRGIHICKSMIAWQKYGNGETPESSGIKGDHLVGKYYVRFNEQYKKEVSDLIKAGIKKEIAEKDAPILLEAKEMLIKWEENDQKVRALWNKLNSWVLDGFNETYKKLGVNFDKNYFESNTYILGKEIVEEGLVKKVFYKKQDGSVWVDLTDEGLDEKLILRSDGTAVYITQDIGTAVQRKEDFNFSHMIYTVGNEQDYHFKVLFLILKKLGYIWSKNCYHLSYGMVDLPSGKMKSREGTVIDADDLIKEMIKTAKDIAQELGKTKQLKPKDIDSLYEKVGMGALKYFLLKVDPKKRMLFDPKESIDFNGNTGPFIQYTYARIQSLLRKNEILINNLKVVSICKHEKQLIKKIIDLPAIIDQSAKEYNPSLLVNYIYDLTKEYNSYYQSVSILNINNIDLKVFRLSVSEMVGRVIKTSMSLLGIDVPERM